MVRWVWVSNLWIKRFKRFKRSKYCINKDTLYHLIKRNNSILKKKYESGFSFRNIIKLLYVNFFLKHFCHDKHVDENISRISLSITSLQGEFSMTSTINKALITFSLWTYSLDILWREYLIFIWVFLRMLICLCRYKYRYMCIHIHIFIIHVINVN